MLGKLKKQGGTLVGLSKNLVDCIWGESRPIRPQEKVRPLGLEFTGKPLGEKIEDLRKELEKKKSAGLIICRCPLIRMKCRSSAQNFFLAMLDEVAWLYNLRGNEYLSPGLGTGA